MKPITISHDTYMMLLLTLTLAMKNPQSRTLPPRARKTLKLLRWDEKYGPAVPKA